MKTNIQPARPVMGFVRSVVTAVSSKTFRRSVFSCALFGALWSQAQALPPGYIDAATYSKNVGGTVYSVTCTAPGGATPSNTVMTNTTIALQEAIKEAYNNNKILFLAEGTYWVNDTLQAWTDTGLPDGDPGYQAPIPRNHLAIIGSTAGTVPVIKLKASATGFGSTATPKVLLEFKNFTVVKAPTPRDPAGVQKFTVQQANDGYFQMLRNVKLDCGGNAGAIGLFFSQAQDSSIEDVTIDATGAWIGLQGVPARSSVIVNLEIIGGNIGIDTASPNNASAGVVLTGLVLTDQVRTAINNGDFVPMTIAGFKIKTRDATSTVAEVPTNKPTLEFCQIQFIDGTIQLGANPSVAAIDNTKGKCIYLRNVYVTGGTGTINLIQSNTAPNAIVTTCAGSNGLVKEYSYRSIVPDAQGKSAENMIDNVVTGGATAPLQTDITTGSAPANLGTRHSWLAKPSWEDSDAIDAGNPPDGYDAVVPGTVDNADLQALIDALHFGDLPQKKIYLRPGIYQLDGPITLRDDTILFGADRNSTRIEVAASWRPTSGSPAVITTDDDSDATTYLGDLTIGVFVDDGSHVGDLPNGARSSDRFTALDWKAGRNSMVHIGSAYAQDNGVKPRGPTSAHNVLRISGNGGGRWYGAGFRRNEASNHVDFRMLKVDGPSTAAPRDEPLWIYGLNLEHGSGPSTYAEVTNSKNIRIYGVKNEMVFGEQQAWNDNEPHLDKNNISVDPVYPVFSQQSAVITFTDVQNIGLFTVGALRNSLDQANGPKGLVQFLGSTTNRVVATLITPQKEDFPFVAGHPELPWDGPTLLEYRTATPYGIGFPNTVALYKRGTMNPTDETLMVHAADAWGAPANTVLPFTSNATDDGWVRDLGSSVVVTNTGTVRVGDHMDNRQYKGFFSFDTSSLPDGATITAATITLRRSFITDATADFSGLGAMKADVRNGSFSGNAALEAGDFSETNAAIATNVVTGLVVPASNGTVTVGTINGTGRAKINVTGKTQVRVYFTTPTNNDSANDYVQFYGGDDATPGNRPVLEVTYH